MEIDENEFQLKMYNFINALQIEYHAQLHMQTANTHVCKNINRVDRSSKDRNEKYAAECLPNSTYCSSSRFMAKYWHQCFEIFNANRRMYAGANAIVDT